MAPVVVTVGALVAVIGSALPWLYSGARGRSSYALFGLSGRLGFGRGGMIEWGLRLWPWVPLVLVLSVVAYWWPRPRAPGWLASVRGGIALVTGLYIVGVAIAVYTAPQVALFRLGIGPAVAAFGGVLVAVAGLWEVLVGLVPEAAPRKHILEHRGPIGHDAVDAEVE